MSEILERLLEQVCDENTFVEFLSALSEDWGDDRRKEQENPSPPFSASANGWENGAIGSFLEAGSAWAVDNKNRERSENPWNEAARIIYSGKYYE